MSVKAADHFVTKHSLRSERAMARSRQNVGTLLACRWPADDLFDPPKSFAHLDQRTTNWMGSLLSFNFLPLRWEYFGKLDAKLWSLRCHNGSRYTHHPVKNKGIFSAIWQLQASLLSCHWDWFTKYKLGDLNKKGERYKLGVSPMNFPLLFTIWLCFTAQVLEDRRFEEKRTNDNVFEICAESETGHYTSAIRKLFVVTASKHSETLERSEKL